MGKTMYIHVPLSAQSARDLREDARAANRSSGREAANIVTRELERRRRAARRRGEERR